MGILSRFRDIMSSNIHARLEKAQDPDKALDDYVRSATRDLGQVKAEAASAAAEENRARRVWDECRAEVRKLQKYAEKCLADGDEDAARRFLERKAPLAQKEARLQTAYEQAASAAEQLQLLRDKLEADLRRMEERRADLKAKMAETREQQRRNLSGSPLGGTEAAFREAEAKVNLAYDEAMAISELRAEEDLDALFAKLDRQIEEASEREARVQNITVDEELAALKADRKQQL